MYLSRAYAEIAKTAYEANFDGLKMIEGMDLNRVKHWKRAESEGDEDEQNSHEVKFMDLRLKVQKSEQNIGEPVRGSLSLPSWAPKYG